MFSAEIMSCRHLQWCAEKDLHRHPNPTAAAFHTQRSSKGDIGAYLLLLRSAMILEFAGFIHLFILYREVQLVTVLVSMMDGDPDTDFIQSLLRTSVP